LDLWRGIACLGVLVFHSAQYALFTYNGDWDTRPVAGALSPLLEFVGRGREGVTLFFVISGYCIAAAVDSARRKEGPVARYFARRIRRIYPPYWIALGLTIVLVTATAIAGFGWTFAQRLGPTNDIPLPHTLTAGQWLGNITLTETWRSNLPATSSLAFVLGQAWTLCYEEQFYAVCGLILWLCPRRMFAAAAVVSLLTAIAYARPSPYFIGTFLDGRWCIFAIGIGVYYTINYRGARSRIVLALFLLAIAVLAKVGPAPRFAREFVYASLFGIVLLGLHRWDARISSAPALRPLRFCGTICYSLYLVHWPVAKLVSHGTYLAGLTSPEMILFVSTPIGILSSIGAGALFHRHVERRFLNTPPPMLNRDGTPATHPRVEQRQATDDIVGIA
jgi:peptidoglycan/LPS O-acetylase OafA/YrhL